MSCVCAPLNWGDYAFTFVKYITSKGSVTYRHILSANSKAGLTPEQRINGSHYEPWKGFTEKEEPVVVKNVQMQYPIYKLF